jgi:hypothetical protein
MTPRLLAAALLSGGFLMIATPPAVAAEPTPSQSSPAPPYSTGNTDIGTLLDNPSTRAVLENHVPQLVANSQIEMARVMTLKQIQSYSSDLLTDEALAKIDADLAKIPAKK